MTNEQAIAELQKEHDLIQGEHDLDGSQFAPALLEALAMAIEALKAQDMTLYMNLLEVSAEEVVEILKRNNRIELLPSAQPEREKGEWIPVHPLQSDDGGAYMCSKCKTGMWEIRPSVYHYCPNCGKPMKRGEQDD